MYPAAELAAFQFGSNVMLNRNGKLVGSIQATPADTIPIGLMTGGEIAADGTKFVRCDMQGGWRLLPGDDRWLLTVSSKTIEEKDILFEGIGCYEVAVAPSDANFAAQIAMTRLFVCNNFKSPAPQFVRVKALEDLIDRNGNNTHGANDGGPARHEQRHMAFDPARPQSLWIGLRDRPGVIWCDNVDALGGARLRTIGADTIPAPKMSGKCIAFDPASGISGGRTSQLYVHVTGFPVLFRISQNTGAITRIEGAPVHCRHLRVHPVSGAVFVIDTLAGGIVRRFTDQDGWTTPRTNGRNLSDVMPHPTDARKVWAIMESGQLIASTDGGLSFSNYTVGIFAKGNIPPFTHVSDVALAQSITVDYFFNSGGQIDPATGHLWMWNGLGVSYVENPPLDSQPFVFKGKAKGIHNVVGYTCQIEPTTGRVDLSCMDISYLRYERKQLTVSPHGKGPNERGIRHSSTSDYASDAPEYVILQSNAQVFHSYDAGKNWSLVPNQPKFPTFTANIACGTMGNAITIGPGEGKFMVQYMAGFGEWREVDFGSPALNEASRQVHWVHAYFLAREILKADKEHPNRFYAYCVGHIESNGQRHPQDSELKGIWRFDIVGSECRARRVYKSRISALTLPDGLAFGIDFWAAKLVLGPKGTAFFTPGGNSRESQRNPVFMYFTPDIEDPNGWMALPNFPTEVRTFLIGAAAPGARYPTLMMRSEHDGYFECADFDPSSPKKASCIFRFKHAPNGILDVPIGGDGDGGYYGRFVFTGGNTGIVLATDYRATIECQG